MGFCNNNMIGYSVKAILLISILTTVVYGIPPHKKQNFKPRFDKNYNPLTLKVHENTQKGFHIAEIDRYAIDDEGDDLLYNIDGKGEEICTIGRTDGILKLKIQPDREAKSLYEFKVLVSDDFEGGVNRAASLDVYLYILDENDNKPVFQETPYQAEISENSKLGVRVVSVRATDRDAGRNKDIRYLFKSDTNHHKFNLDPNTGVITVSGELDYETEPSYILDIIAKDEGSPSLTAQTRVVVDVQDIGDNKPHFVVHNYEKDIKENLPKGTSIAVVSAQDGDKSINNEINYAIIGGDEYGLFVIDKKTGNVTVKGDLDREYYSKFEIRIKAYEVAQAESFATVDLKINLLDENDNKPEFNQRKYIIKVKEEILNSKTILSKDIKAIDADATWENNYITYWIRDNDYFEVLPESGTLILKEDLKEKSKDRYSLLVYATERETVEHYTTQTNVTILVTKSHKAVISHQVGGRQFRSSDATIYTFNALLLATPLFSLLW